MKRALWSVAAVAAAAGLLIFVSMPPARLMLPSAAAGDGTIAGILHIHTNRSDGRSSPDEIAAIAARAGLKFLVFTDHGDGTRTPDPPAYRSGVLCIDGVEISTTAGHYVAIGLPAAPYPLGGEPRDVVEDVRRLGGFGIVAHPDSPKRELRWGDWDAPIDGMEIINLDSGWRAWARQPGFGSKFGLLAALGTYPVRPSETIAHLFDRGSSIVQTWISVTEGRRLVGIAGDDAHAKLALWDVEPGDNSFTLPFPGYEAAFRTLSVHIRPDRPLSGDAPADAAAVLQGLRAGHLYTAIDAFATPAFFEFSATNQHGTVQQGDELPVDGPLTLRVSSNAPRESWTTIWKGNHILIDRLPGPELTVPAAPGVYRVEIDLTKRGPSLWIISNPIYVRDSKDAGPPVVKPAPTASDLMFPAKVPGWNVEHDADSRADLIATQDELTLQFTLGPDALKRPRVALVAVPHGLLPNDRLTFTMRAGRPMRISVQLRTGVSGPPEERWQRSVYVDTTEREQTVFFSDFTPVGPTQTERPALAAVPSVLFVIETTNTKAGSSGTLWIKSVALRQ